MEQNIVLILQSFLDIGALSSLLLEIWLILKVQSVLFVGSLLDQIASRVLLLVGVLSTETSLAHRKLVADGVHLQVELFVLLVGDLKLFLRRDALPRLLATNKTLRILSVHLFRDKTVLNNLIYILFFVTVVLNLVILLRWLLLTSNIHIWLVLVLWLSESTLLNWRF